MQAPKPSKKHKDLIVRVVQLKNDLGAAGLYRTMHAMESVVKEVGWEVAYQLEKKHRR